MVSRVHNFHALVETMHCHGRLLRKSLHVVETVKRVMLHFHCLVVPVGLARLWIPAFAGMTMKAKAAVMGSFSENRCMLFKSSTACFRVGVGIGIGIDLATLVDGPTLLPGRYLPRYRPRNCWLNVTHFHHPVVTARRHSRHLRKSPFKRGWRPFSGAGGCQACRWDIPLALSRRPPFQGGINFHPLVVPAL